MDLEIQRDLAVRSGRLYPNLDRFVEHGLVEKREHDGRTNTYRITSVGAALLGDLGLWLADAAEEVSIQSI